MTDSPPAQQPCPWYEAVRGESLAQGDILTDVRFPVLTGPFDDWQTMTSVPAEWVVNTVVILSQSCDLDIEHGEAESVIVCPMYSTEAIKEQHLAKKPYSAKDLTNRVEHIRKGNQPALHMLPPCRLPEHRRDTVIVNFWQTTTVPLQLIRAIVAAMDWRLRLLPPYREHLGQAFARFVMRVGLPQNFQSENN